MASWPRRRAAAAAVVGGRRAPVAAGRGEGQCEYRGCSVQLRNGPGQLEATHGGLAMDAGRGAREAPAVAVCSARASQGEGASRATDGGVGAAVQC
jgi:hypothetical protein